MLTTNYLVDTNNPTGYAQVLEEIQDAHVVRSYSYGLDLISQTQKLDDGSWQLSFYGYDGHGSVRYLTNAEGNVTDTYDYDGFGNLINSTGTTQNNYLYAGEQFDPDLTLYYNRARYLDVRTGRFWGMDVYEGDPQSPSSLHKYLYTANEPIGRVDPSGRDFTATALSVASTILEALNALATAHLIFTTVKTFGQLTLDTYEEKITVEEAWDAAKRESEALAIQLFLNFALPSVVSGVVRRLGNLGLLRIFTRARINGRLAEHYIGNLYGVFRNEGEYIGRYLPDFINSRTIREVKNVSELKWSGRVMRQMTAYAEEAAQSGRKLYINVRGSTNVDPRLIQKMEEILGPEGSAWSITYGYDDIYRLTSETIAGAAQQNGTIGYVYDSVGNRKTLTSTVAAIPAGVMNYDANDRISTDVSDNNGNNLGAGGTENVYDFENHLVRKGDISIVYDGDGNRVSKTKGVLTTNYLGDTDNSDRIRASAFRRRPLFIEPLMRCQQIPTTLKSIRHPHLPPER